MRTITITTTQNVTIEYELADLKDRTIGWLLDFMIIFGTIFVLLMVTTALFAQFSEDILRVILLLTSAPIFFLYTLVSEIIMNGQTLGKRAVGIRVVKTTGTEPRMGDYFLRWVFRMVDIYFSAGSLAAIMVSSSARHQRLGGMISNTAVIKVKPTRNFSLENILAINSKEDYEIKYPEVRAFSESDMLFIKNVLERSRKYSNTAHRKVLSKVTQQVARDLGLSKTPENPQKFLRNVIMDYIVLTR